MVVIFIRLDKAFRGDVMTQTGVHLTVEQVCCQLMPGQCLFRSLLLQSQKTLIRLKPRVWFLWRIHGGKNLYQPGQFFCGVSGLTFFIQPDRFEIVVLISGRDLFGEFGFGFIKVATQIGLVVKATEVICQLQHPFLRRLVQQLAGLLSDNAIHGLSVLRLNPLNRLD